MKLCTRLALRDLRPAPRCWNGYSHLAHLRQRFERCDAHWHRPKRADWRAKAYERAARWACTATPGLKLDGPFCSLHWDAVHPAKQIAYSGRCTS